MSTTEYDELHYRLQELDRQITELHRTGYRVDELIAKRDGMKRALDAMRPAQRPPTATKRKPAGRQSLHILELLRELANKIHTDRPRLRNVPKFIEMIDRMTQQSNEARISFEAIKSECHEGNPE